ncbi:extracellular catalytic domain type 1 short-chain-length polyhydroxyalkanoate depolymerase [Sphingomonas sp. CLY1604]|uniref:extracellular catalytic domain type 1 short-chain-length polyhydroxyalkanoate depolymerase n=1 Tax=Sphingomonas sp. CLY1604 TaxID=3457786 RepID=UPI003FD81FDF
MPRLSETLARLSRLRASHGGVGSPADAGRLTELASFGANPGALRALVHVPDEVAESPALVIVLHGCTQTAGAYDLGSGWSEMADRHGFILLFPEQQRQNNPNLCFNWFSPEDNRRDHGEARSIREMIAAVADRYAVDPARTFVTGLSAGGAMASVMLAAYPEIFAGGSIIAGLPFGCANTMPEAFGVMRGQGTPGEPGLAALIRGASRHGGPWPTISVWHGSDDATVNPVNAHAIVEQWRTVHGVSSKPSRVDMVDGHPRRVWRDGAGRDVIEEFSVAGMGHGTPLDTTGEHGCGKSGPYMLDVGISSTRHICAFWGLTGHRIAGGQAPGRTVADASDSQARSTTSAPDAANAEPALDAATPAGGVTDVGQVIERALRAAGLMR